MLSNVHNQYSHFTNTLNTHTHEIISERMFQVNNKKKMYSRDTFPKKTDFSCRFSFTEVYFVLRRYLGKKDLRYI